MNSLNQFCIKFKQVPLIKIVKMSVGDLGKGAGRGGGSGGSIREAGGSLGQMGAAREEEYFHKQKQEQLAKLQSKLRKTFDRDSISKSMETRKLHKSASCKDK